MHVCVCRCVCVGVSVCVCVCTCVSVRLSASTFRKLQVQSNSSFGFIWENTKECMHDCQFLQHAPLAIFSIWISLFSVHC